MLPPESGRERAWSGSFVNTLPMLLRVPTSGPFGRWARGVQDGVADLLEHRWAGTDEIRAWCDLAEGPLFDAGFVWHEPAETSPAGSSTDLALESGSSLAALAREPLRLTVSTSRRTLDLSLSYAPGCFDAATIARFARQLASGIERACDEPGLDLSLFSVSQHSLCHDNPIMLVTRR